MKKIFFIVLALVAITFLGRTIIQGSKEQTVKAPAAIPKAQTQTVAPQSPAIPKGQPTSLSIPALNITADVESVGMDSEGRMDVPKDDFNVAWYNLGFKPGAIGSSVIAGHFDARSGGPAIFYKLSTLKSGDEITVSYGNGEKFTFTVTESELYDVDDFPLQRVFNTTDKPRLNLITCDGVFDKQSRNYSERLVVYAELAES